MNENFQEIPAGGAGSRQLYTASPTLRTNVGNVGGLAVRYLTKRTVADLPGGHDGRGFWDLLDWHRAVPDDQIGFGRTRFPFYKDKCARLFEHVYETNAGVT